MRWLRPSPNSSSFECCERNPEPAIRTRVARPWSVSTVTRAPTASRLLFVPVRRSDEGRVARGEVVAEEAQLRRGAGRQQHHVGSAVAVVVEHREGAAVLVDVEAGGARDVVEPAVAVVAQEHVALVLGLRPVAHQEPVGRAPAVVVAASRASASSGDWATTWRQKKLSTSTDGSSSLAGEHAVRDVEVLPAVVVEVEARRTTRPSGRTPPPPAASRPRTCRRPGCGRASCRGRAGGRSPGSPAGASGLKPGRAVTRCPAAVHMLPA